MDIWSFNLQLTRQLRRWAYFSIITGIILQFFSRLSRGIGTQFIGWGIVNYLIAWGGSKSTQARREALPNPETPDQQQSEANNLHRLLVINSFLDVLYIAGGFGLARTNGHKDQFARGSGIGILLQGAFLLVFDIFQAFRLQNRFRTGDGLIDESS